MAGLLYGWGENSYSSLGVGDSVRVSTPVQIGSALWQQVSAWDNSTLGIQEDGTLWGWGRNYFGELGLGDNVPRPTPTQIGTAKWLRVSLGARTAIGIQEDGTLWGWGRNGIGELGAGIVGNQVYPVMIDPGMWSDVTVGGGWKGDALIAIRGDGLAFGGGDCYYRQLGNLGGAASTFPTAVSGDHIWGKIQLGEGNSPAGSGITVSGGLYVWGTDANYYNPSETYNKSIPHQIGSGRPWVDLAEKDDHNAAADSDGKLWVWGSALYGALGMDPSIGAVNVPTEVSIGASVVKVAVSRYSTFAITDDGRVYATGSYLETGLGLSSHISVFTEIPELVASSIFCSRKNIFAIAGDAGPSMFWTNFAGQTEIL